MLRRTSSEFAPWYVIPTDHKWSARVLVVEMITTKIRALDLQYPKFTEQQMQEILATRKELSREQ